jgi:hypothetical protein
MSADDANQHQEDEEVDYEEEEQEDEDDINVPEYVVDPNPRHRGRVVSPPPPVVQVPAAPVQPVRRFPTASAAASARLKPRSAPRPNTARGAGPTCFEGPPWASGGIIHRPGRALGSPRLRTGTPCEPVPQPGTTRGTTGPTCSCALLGWAGHRPGLHRPEPAPLAVPGVRAGAAGAATATLPCRLVSHQRTNSVCGPPCICQHFARLCRYVSLPVALFCKVSVNTRPCIRIALW